MDNDIVRGERKSQVDQTMSKHATLEPHESNIQWLLEFENPNSPRPSNTRPARTKKNTTTHHELCYC